MIYQQEKGREIDQGIRYTRIPFHDIDSSRGLASLHLAGYISSHGVHQLVERSQYSPGALRNGSQRAHIFSTLIDSAFHFPNFLWTG